MILLFSDYGHAGPYLGQVETLLHSRAPGQKVINLMADAPGNNPKASAYLLASLIGQTPENAILFCVVDPGVGSGADQPVALHIDGRWCVGPDNGLFDIVCRRASEIEAMIINWRPENLSSSFHGRDLYAPVCVMIANHDFGFGKNLDWQDRHHWPDDLEEIIYIDYFGNCMSGVRAAKVDNDTTITIKGTIISHAETFARVNPGQAFWYENSNGLVEIAVNRGSVAERLGLTVSDQILI